MQLVYKRFTGEKEEIAKKLYSESLDNSFELFNTELMREILDVKSSKVLSPQDLNFLTTPLRAIRLIVTKPFNL